MPEAPRLLQDGPSPASMRLDASKPYILISHTPATGTIVTGDTYLAEERLDKAGYKFSDITVEGGGWYLPASRQKSIPAKNREEREEKLAAGREQLARDLESLTGAHVEMSVSSAANGVWPLKGIPNLPDYDIILVNSSAGKDSQAMASFVTPLAHEAGVADRLIIAHNDLGLVEWPGTRELAELQAQMLGVPFLLVPTRPQGDLLEQIRARGKFPSAATRFCTSMQKTAQTMKVVNALVGDAKLGRPTKVLYLLGERAEESTSRSRKQPFTRWDLNGVRIIDRWLPIHDWDTFKVWQTIDDSGLPHHAAYDAGMSRLSCSHCVLGAKADLIRAARHRPELTQEYVKLEADSGHRFQDNRTMASIAAEAAKLGPLPPVSAEPSYQKMVPFLGLRPSDVQLTLSM